MTSNSLLPPSLIRFPALALVVSGGHTELILMRDHGDYELLGRTKDDAAGECFDKVGKLLDLPYPGGPKISELAVDGNPAAIPFPRPMLTDKKRSAFYAPRSTNYDFSFAGLKTAALYWLRDNVIASPDLVGAKQSPSQRPTKFEGIATAPPWAGPRNDRVVTREDFCASLEAAIVDVLVGKTMAAALQYQPRTIILCGGVAANEKLRQTLGATIKQHSPNSLFLIPDSKHCMDNAAMIAVAGYYQAKQGKFTHWQDLNADPNWTIA